MRVNRGKEAGKGTVMRVLVDTKIVMDRDLVSDTDSRRNSRFSQVSEIVDPISTLAKNFL